jgi:hypothetical protein
MLGYHYFATRRLTEAKAVREKTCIFLSEMHNPKHPLIPEAAEKLNMILNLTDNDYDAERFARICYESLTHPPLNPESFKAAKAIQLIWWVHPSN